MTFSFAATIRITVMTTPAKQAVIVRMEVFQ